VGSVATDFHNDLGIRLALRQVARTLDFSGRTTRTEVISYWVFAVLAEVSLSLLTSFAWNIATWNSPWFFTSVAILFAVPEPGILIRRLHDQNRSGWWALVCLPYAFLAWFGGPRAERPLWEHVLTVVVSLVVLLFLLWAPTPGSNRYGPDPRLNYED
jgi:uncharacterized membrane protein YhaH (DUF805 family)